MREMGREWAVKLPVLRWAVGGFRSGHLVAGEQVGGHLGGGVEGAQQARVPHEHLRRHAARIAVSRPEEAGRGVRGRKQGREHQNFECPGHFRGKMNHRTALPQAWLKKVETAYA